MNVKILLENPIIKYCLIYTLVIIFIIAIFRLIKFISSVVYARKTEKQIEKENEEFKQKLSTIAKDSNSTNLVQLYWFHKIFHYFKK